jgi:hypothetical protein
MTISTTPAKTAILRWGLVILLAIAFGYIEAAVVVYLRQIFHPDGFTFPLKSFPLSAESRNFAFVEIGREAATIVLILSACLLAGQNRRQRAAYFMTIFAAWDIFYYVWLKALIDWPASIMDWDVLFLIPVPWAGPVVAPVLVSAAMLVFAGIILYRDGAGRTIKVTSGDWLGFCAAGVVTVVSFCVPGLYISEAEYASYFSWPLFLAGLLAAVIVFTQCVYKKSPQAGPGANQ